MPHGATRRDEENPTHDDESSRLMDESPQATELTKQPSPSCMGRLRDLWSPKAALLIAMIVQNSSFSLLRRYATAIAHTTAATSSIFFVQEAIKLVVSMWKLLEEPKTRDGINEHGSFLGFLFMHAGQMLVPASIYLVMALLGFIALARIPAGLFAVLQQFKLVSTAVLSVVMLKRELSWAKWRSLLTLLVGVVLITIATRAAQAEPPVPCPEVEISGGLVDPNSRADRSRSLQEASDSVTNRGFAGYIIGVAAVFAEAWLSGFANVYFEKVVKGTSLSIWHRNVQLATWSLIMYFSLAVQDTGGYIFQGWDRVIALIAILGALGGLLVALCITIFDAIVKSVTSTLSIVVTAVAGWLLLAGPMSTEMALAGAVVILATTSYSFS